MNRFTRATLALLLLATSGCGGDPELAPVTDRQFELLQRSGRTAFDAGDPAQAALLDRQALDRALLRADASAIAQAAIDLAAAHARGRDYDAALATLDETEPLLGTLGAERRALLRAQVRFERGELDLAGATLDDAEREPGLRPLVVGYRGLIAASRGDAVAARAWREQLPDTASPALTARLDGELASLVGDYAAAATHFEHEAEAQRSRGNYAATAEALARAGEAHARAGDAAAARQSYLLAVQSARQQDGNLPAEAWQARAEALRNTGRATDGTR